MRKNPKTYPRLVAGLLGIVVRVDSEEEERRFFRSELLAFVGSLTLVGLGIVAVLVFGG